jgi:hypothetical protein
MKKPSTFFFVSLCLFSHSSFFDCSFLFLSPVSSSYSDKFSSSGYVCFASFGYSSCGLFSLVVPFFDRLSNFSNPVGTFRPPPWSSSGFLFSSLLNKLKFTFLKGVLFL